MPYLAALLSVGVSIYSVWYLFPSSRPRPWKKRLASFAALFMVFLVPALRVSTGWSAAWSYVAGAELITAVTAYLGLTTAFWVLAPEGKLDFIGRTISLSFLVAIFLKPTKVLFLSLLLAWALQGSPLRSARVDSTHSYTIFDQEALIGGAHYEGCVVYQNPGWFPLIHRRTNSSALEHAYCPH